MNRLRVLTAALTLGLGLTSCALGPLTPNQLPPSPSASAVDESIPTPSNVEDRVRAVLARTGGDEMVEVKVNTYGVEVDIDRDGRRYTYREDDSDPRGAAAEGAAQPFTLAEVDLPQIMTSTLEIDSSCAEPRWQVTAAAYGLWTTRLDCTSGAVYFFWPDGSLIDVSTSTEAAALDLVQRFGTDSPAQVYELVVSNRTQTGDQVSITYADPQLGAVEVSARSDEHRPLSVQRLAARAYPTFPLAEVQIDQVVACGHQQMDAAQNSWWFVNIRYSTIHNQVVMKWDTAGGWTSVGPLTDVNCRALG